MSEKTTITPLNDRVLVRHMPEESKQGGLVIPDGVKDTPDRGEVVAVGDGHINPLAKERLPLQVKVGDVVLYGKYSGNMTVRHNGEDLLLMREDEIFAVVR